MTLPTFDLSTMTDKTKWINMLRDAVITHDTRITKAELGVKEHEERLDKLETIVISGDGDKELSHAERIRNLETLANSVKYWGRFVGGALVLNFIGFSVGILVAYFKFLPVLERLANTP